MDVLHKLQGLRKEVAALRDVPDELVVQMEREARQIMLDLETPQHTVYRTAFSQLEIVSISIGCHSGLFKSLATSSPQTVQEVAKSTGVDPLLAARVLRCLAAYQAVDQVSPDTFSANKITHVFSHDGPAAAIEVNLEIHGKAWPVLPGFLKESGWKNFTGHSDTPETIAWGMPKGSTIFDVFRDSGHNDAFNFFIKMSNSGFKSWTTIYPVQDRIISGLKTDDPQAALMVDVGGGNGHQAIRFREEFPQFHGRYIVQDFEHTFPAERPDGIEFQVHDFNNEQPIKGARFYYLRMIAHDWPDEVVAHICTQIRKVMTPGYSRLLINDAILPEVGASPFHTSLDLTMMAGSGGMERNEGQHREYLEKAGLKVTGAFRPTEPGSLGIIEAEVA